MSKNMYPEWMRKWNERAEDLDGQVLDFFQRLGIEVGDLAQETGWQLGRWAEDIGLSTSQYVAERQHMREMHAWLRRYDSLSSDGEIERQREMLLRI